MIYIFVIVDDGLLDLINFKILDFWNNFYVCEVLGICMWDMYDDVLGVMVGSYGLMFSIGGDEILKLLDLKVNCFKFVVKFIGFFSIGKGKSCMY